MCVFDTRSDMIGKVNRKVRKQGISQEMINKTGQRRKLKNVNNEEGRKHHRRLMNELKRAADKAKNKQNL